MADSLGEGVVNAATWVTPTAEFAVNALRSEYGVDDNYAKNQLNLVGHSLGPYVASEMGRLFRDSNGTGVRTITALDTGAEFTAPDDRFNLDGRIDGDGRRELTPFRDVSAFSRSFYGESSLLGSERNSLTADEAYQMDFSVRNEDGGRREEHFRVIRAFRNLASEPGLIGDLLGIPAYSDTDNSLPVDDFEEIIGGRDRGKNSSVGFEGIIDVNSQNEPTLLVAQRDTGEQDSIVIGSKVSNNLEGFESRRGGRDTSGNSRFFEEGNDKLLGEGNTDVIEGKTGNDILSGGLGSDELFGGDNDDILYGGDEFSSAQRDELTGGAGNDIFALRRENATDTAGDADLVKDFNLENDRIGLIGSLNSGELVFNESGDNVSIGTSQDGILAVLEGRSADDIISSDRNLFTANNFSGTALGDTFAVS